MKLRRIRTADLRASDVPPIADTWFADTPTGEDAGLMDFALSFDGYEFFQENDEGSLGDVCNPVATAYENHPNILKSFNTSGLRMLLFFEQRRSKWHEESHLTDYAKALIEAIRERLTAV